MQITLRDMFAPVRWAYALYFSHWRVWTLSILVAALRADQVIRSAQGLAGEVLVEALRIVQILLAIAASKNVAVTALANRSAWKPRDAASLSKKDVVLGLVGARPKTFRLLWCMISGGQWPSALGGCVLNLAELGVKRARIPIPPGATCRLKVVAVEVIR